MARMCPSTPQYGGGGPQGVGGSVCKLDEGHSGDHRSGAASWPNSERSVDVKFRLDISLGGDMTLTYSQIAGSLRRLADGLLDCQPEQGDSGTVVVDGQTCGTWRIE